MYAVTLWDDHFEEAVKLVRRELSVPGIAHSQDYLMSLGRLHGIGPLVMKTAAASLGIVTEKKIHSVTRRKRTYWRFPD